MTADESHRPNGERPSSAEDAYARLLALRESGTAPDFEAWVREFPEFEAELRALDGSWDRVERSLERVLGSTVLVTPPPPVPSLRRGARIGEFELERLIGAGGMGVVWLARQPALDREVALKFVRPDRQSIQSPELFAREARAAGRANDPRIVTVHAVGESEGLRWLAMEHVPGRKSLATWLGELRTSGAPEGHARRAAAFVADVAEALHTAHELGVVHRDIKPQNVLIAPDGTPKLTDFGLARLVDEDALSETLTIRGTVEYMSPEQVTGDTHGLDHRSDVFSLGVLLYELLTLERPFTGVTPIEVITRIAAREPRRPSQLVEGLEPELDVIVGKALEKRADERYASAQEFARDLRRWLAHEPIAARPPTPWQRLVKWTRRNPVQAVAGAALALLLLVGGVAGYRIWKQNQAMAAQQVRAHLIQALWDIDSGRLDSAAEQIASLYRFGTEDPEGHLVLAMGYARYLRFAEAEVELERAMELGFSPELGPEPEARDLYLRGLWLVAQRDASRHAEAADLFTRAVAEDPSLEQVWFPLYQMRKSIGDLDGARDALVRFRDSIAKIKPVWSVADALVHELDGRYADAVTELEALEGRVEETDATDLRLHRHLGRNRLLLFLEDPSEETTLLRQAEQALGLAVEEWGEDGYSLASLGLVTKVRADFADDPVEQARLLREAREFAERAEALGFGLDMAAQVQAMVAYDDLARDFDAESTPESRVDEAEQRVDELRRLMPHAEVLERMESGIAYYRGAFASERGDKPAARAYWEESVDLSAHQVYARVKLGQRLYMGDGDFAGAQALFEEALAIWDRHEYGCPGFDPSRERKWLLAATIWRFGAADHAGDLDAAREARDRSLDELAENDDQAEPEEMESLAEFLAMPVHEELKDCDEAKRILDQYRVEEAFRDQPAYLQLIADIRAACP